MAGLAVAEIGTTKSLVTALSGPEDFVIDPLPNLLFTRDSSVWVQDRPTVTSLAMPARRRETQLTDLIYTFHPRFAGRERLHGSDLEYLEGGDVLALADGVLAVGRRRADRARPGSSAWPAPSSSGVWRTRCSPSRSTRTAPRCTSTPSAPWSTWTRWSCTRTSPTAWPRSRSGPGTAPTWTSRRWRPSSRPPRGRWASTSCGSSTPGLDPVTAEREQWDDGNNTLAIGPKLAVAYERNVETNERLELAGIEVIRIAGSELGSGPRRPAVHVLPDQPRPALIGPRGVRRPDGPG